jgi:hypothetical protein
MAAGRGEFTENSCRGVALFVPFDPWRTCKTFSPGSARYFDAATRLQLLSMQEAEKISQILLRFCSQIESRYDGVFRSYFADPRVSIILRHINDLSYLSASGLAIADSWVDRLFDACPGPLLPNEHIQVNSFSQVDMREVLNIYTTSPWIAWVEALDIACLGPWFGFQPARIIQLIEALCDGVPCHTIDTFESPFGYRVKIPIYSRGLQGFVSGGFYDVPKSQREPIFNTLLQFGETIGDVYANLRCQHFFTTLDAAPDDDALARELISLISPVNKLTIKRGGRCVGYRLCHEQSYFAGYHPLSSAELLAERLPHGFNVNGPYGSEIYVEPIGNLPNFNPEFARMRLESYLLHSLGSIVIKPDAATLAYEDVQRLRVQLEAYTDDRAASVAKLRQFYVVKQVEENWAAGAVKVTNHELRRFLEHLGRATKNGYQVTSYKAEFEKIFLGKVSASSTRNALSLSWNTA